MRFRLGRERLVNLIAQSALIAPALYHQSGQTPAALLSLQQAIALAPLKEELRYRTIELLLATDQSSAALDAYRTYQATLREEVGEQPSPRLRSLVAHILLG